MKNTLVGVALALVLAGSAVAALASFTYSQVITLEPGWSTVSTPRVLDSHVFSAAQISANFDIYVLDAGQPSGWATMAAIGQTEFQPLYGYFINNKTGVTQTLTLHYKDGLTPSQRLFSRSISSTGWNSIGVANPTYAIRQCENATNTDNASNILFSLDGKISAVVDFTTGEYATDPASVFVSDTWTNATPSNLNSLNDLRDTKGYAVYVTSAASYAGSQDQDNLNACQIGSLQSADFISSLNNEEVGEGENDILVSGLDLEADSGSDLRILSVRLGFEEQNAGGSQDLDDYADEISLWFDGEKIASANVSDFSDDAGIWSMNITPTGDAVIPANSTKQLTVAVSALPNIDSSDLNANNFWYVTIKDVQFMDEPEGAVTTEGVLDDIGADRPFNFVDFSTAADLELNLDEASDNPDSRVVDVDDSSTTDNVVLLTGDLEATGGDIEVKELTVNVVSTGADLDVIASALILEVDGDVRQTLQTSECGGSGYCVFDDVDEVIAQSDSVKIRVLVDIEGTDDIGLEGAILEAMIGNSATNAEDADGNTLATGDLIGAAHGKAQAFYSEGIMMEFVSASESKATNDGEPDTGTFTIKFKVTAFDTDTYVANSCSNISAPIIPGIAGEGLKYGFESDRYDGDCALSNTDETANGNYEVLDGETHTFTLNVTVTGNGQFERVFLDSLNWASSDITPDQFLTFNLHEFTTDSLYLWGEEVEPEPEEPSA